MGIFYTIALKIEGQIKPTEKGKLAKKELELICAKYSLNITEDKSGFCSEGYNKK